MTEAEAIAMIRGAKKELDESAIGWGRIEIIVSGGEYSKINISRPPKYAIDEGGVVKLSKYFDHDEE